MYDKTLKVAQTEVLARYAEEHKLTVKEALRLAAKRLVLQHEVNPDDPIFTRLKIGRKTGVKNRDSVDHDKILYRSP